MINAVEYSGVCTLALIVALAFLRAVCRERDAYRRALNDIQRDEERAAKGEAKPYSAWNRAEAALRCECEPMDENYIKYRREKGRVFEGF